MISLLFYLLISSLYALLASWIIRGLARLRPPRGSEASQSLSIVIAARNEEQNIAFALGTLIKQSHPREKLEIIVVDDHSDDATRTIVERIAAKYPAVQLLAAPGKPDASPKKQALAAGIAAASGEVILTFDADCAAPPRWAEKIGHTMTADTAAAAAWVLIPDEKGLAARIEFLDALALQLIGAAAIGWGRPFLANGANLAFRKQAFVAAGGYQGIDTLGSGDDDLFIQKLAAAGRGRIIFVTDPDAAVTTFPVKSWHDFYTQRIRWSSKAALYPVWIKALEASLFIYYLALLLGLPLALLLGFPLWSPLIALAVKIGCDAMVMRRGVRMVQRSWSWLPLILASLHHIVYLPVIGLIGQFGRFTWKGRSYYRGRL